jgi:hypothetical protein
MHTYTHLILTLYSSIHIYTNIYTHIYTHIYIHTYIYTHIYTHIYTAPIEGHHPKPAGKETTGNNSNWRHLC